MITELKQDNFASFISNATTPVLVDLWASWCGPCKMLSPLVDQLAEELAGSLTVGKVNVDDEPEIAAQYGVQSIPTLLLFKNGELVDKNIGYVPLPALKAFVQKAM